MNGITPSLEMLSLKTWLRRLSVSLPQLNREGDKDQAYTKDYPNQMGNPGPGGGGGCLRDHNGDMVMAFSLFLGHCTNNIAEASAILIGMIWCIDNEVLNVIIESDSLIVIDAINKKNTSHWKIKRHYRKD
ncbi:hypothetical protein RND71_005774 [Anisodus tanguticus]|uniref:RNase H type-1 domain-containing protein n=1 Tax=Anisodus tanguticus TaxID=243964 RepID=A0AAE1VN11_9SOLA|nr:hypothetical protein RND71_005774 [Anisodus tanguticus]